MPVFSGNATIRPTTRTLRTTSFLLPRLSATINLSSTSRVSRSVSGASYTTLHFTVGVLYFSSKQTVSPCRRSNDTTFSDATCSWMVDMSTSYRYLSPESISTFSEAPGVTNIATSDRSGVFSVHIVSTSINDAQATKGKNIRFKDFIMKKKIRAAAVIQRPRGGTDWSSGYFLSL